MRGSIACGLAFEKRPVPARCDPDSTPSHGTGTALVRCMNKCIALLLLATGAPAFADDARPFVHSPRGPGVDHGALSLGASAFFDDDGNCQ